MRFWVWNLYFVTLLMEKLLKLHLGKRHLKYNQCVGLFLKFSGSFSFAQNVGYLCSNITALNMMVNRFGYLIDTNFEIGWRGIYWRNPHYENKFHHLGIVWFKEKIYFIHIENYFIYNLDFQIEWMFCLGIGTNLVYLSSTNISPLLRREISRVRDWLRNLYFVNLLMVNCFDLDLVMKYLIKNQCAQLLFSSWWFL